MTQATADVEKFAIDVEHLLSLDTASLLKEDEQLRARVLKSCRKLSVRLESPSDTIQRLSYAPLPFAVARIGVQIGLWSTLANRFPESVTLVDLVAITRVDEALLVRLLRFAVANGFVDRFDGDRFCATNISRTLSTAYGETGLRVIQTCMVEALQSLPEWLAQHDHKEPSDPEDTPFALGKGLGRMSAWAWLENEGEVLADFNRFIQLGTDHRPKFTNSFPLDRYLDPEDSAERAERIQFVDVGGGNGQICESVLEKYPRLRNRIVLQNAANLAEMGSKANSGYESLAYNFFDPQSIQGARVYYLREVLHDWPDKQCLAILHRLRDALAEDSVILIDEIVMSWDPLHPADVANDLLVMCALAAKERSLQEWDRLFAASGLQRIDTHYYSLSGQAVQVVRSA